MKKYLLVLTLSVLMLCLPLASVSASSVDILKGTEPVNAARTVFVNSISNATDGDDDTYLETNYNFSVNNDPYGSYAYLYKLPQAMSLSKVRIKVDSIENFKSIGFEDAAGKGLYTVQLKSTEQTIILDEVKMSKEVKQIRIYVTNKAPLKLYSIEAYSDQVQSPEVQAPADLVANAGDSKIDLSWSTVPEATSYKVKRSTTSGGPYQTVTDNVYDTKYTDTTVTNGVTYYYVVTANLNGIESEYSNEASATPTATPVVSGNRARVVVSLISGLEKEYDLSNSELTAFISWYNNRADGIGQEVYAFNKNYDLKNYISRKDFIAFSKIEMFEVNEYVSN
ncbi:hypothetical protein [Paenibacillus sp. FSL K6-0108]|uniref:hypothetical protein n=1 Tax=Paenibacillus sp. FSL K6-0108 TaxID=2921417 RepID=UPI00324C8337